MERARLHALIDAVTPAEAVARLGPYLTPARRARIEEVMAGRVRSVHVAVEHPGDPHNAAAIVRTVEALGGGCVHAISDSSGVLRRRRTTTGAFHWLETRHYRALDEFLAAIRAPRPEAPAGMILAGACVDTGEGAVLPLPELPVDRPMCVMFGNEKLGLTGEARAACDHLFSIPMYGMTESLNLSVAAAITLHDVLRRRRALIGDAGDGTDAWVLETRARWYARTLDPRLVEGLLGAGVQGGAARG